MAGRAELPPLGVAVAGALCWPARFLSTFCFSAAISAAVRAEQLSGAPIPTRRGRAQATRGPSFLGGSRKSDGAGRFLGSGGIGMGRGGVCQAARRTGWGKRRNWKGSFWLGRGAAKLDRIFLR